MGIVSTHGAKLGERSPRLQFACCHSLITMFQRHFFCSCFCAPLRSQNMQLHRRTARLGRSACAEAINPPPGGRLHRPTKEACSRGGRCCACRPARALRSPWGLRRRGHLRSLRAGTLRGRAWPTWHWTHNHGEGATAESRSCRQGLCPLDTYQFVSPERGGGWGEDSYSRGGRRIRHLPNE